MLVFIIWIIILRLVSDIFFRGKAKISLNIGLLDCLIIVVFFFFMFLLLGISVNYKGKIIYLYFSFILIIIKYFFFYCYYCNYFVLNRNLNCFFIDIYNIFI